MAEEGQRVAFHRSLAGRLILWGVLPMVGLSATILTVGATSRFRALRAAAEQMLQDGARLAAARIEDGNNNAGNLASTLAGAQVAGLLGERRQSLLLLAIVLERTPWCRSVFYAYEPDADGKDATALAAGIPAAAMTESGRFVPRWTRTHGGDGSTRLEALANPDENPGYVLALHRFRRDGRLEVSIGDPHRDGEDRVIDYVAPIAIDGQFFGIAGVERSLHDVDALLAEVASRDRTRAFLLSPTGRVVTAAGEFTGEISGAESRATPYAEHLRRALDASDDSTTIERVDDPVTDEEMYFVSAPIGTGRWRLVLARPTSTVTGPIRNEVLQLASVALVGLGTVLGVLVALALRYSKGVAAAVRLSSRVAEGDLTAEMKMDAPKGSEAELLGASLCRMTRQLDRLVSEVKRAAIRLHATATQVAATSAEQERSAQEFSRHSSEIAAAVREITRTGDELAGTSRTARSEADETSQIATSSREALGQMEQSMRELEGAAASVAQRLAAINEKASAITAIVDTITRVADQTNLLSVNAAIEAEKAGESGRGFLVVAREVRRLADQAASATVQIERMVGEMQSAVSSGVMEMDRFADHVRRGVSEVDRIGGQLGQVIEQVAVGTARFSAVDDGVAQQNDGARRIDEAMVRLAAGARQTEASIGEFAAAAAGLREAIASLGNVVNGFKLRS